MKITDTIKKTNETLYISIPKKIAEILNIEYGDVVEVDISKIKITK